MLVTRLQVAYKSQDIDRELDEKILQFFNTLDFICTNRTYNSLSFDRYLHFERHTKEVDVHGVGTRWNKKVCLEPEVHIV